MYPEGTQGAAAGPAAAAGGAAAADKSAPGSPARKLPVAPGSPARPGADAAAAAAAGGDAFAKGSGGGRPSFAELLQVRNKQELVNEFYLCDFSLTILRLPTAAADAPSQASLRQEFPVRSWCDTDRAYHRMLQVKEVANLPQVRPETPSKRPHSSPPYPRGNANPPRAVRTKKNITQKSSITASAR